MKVDASGLLEATACRPIAEEEPLGAPGPTEKSGAEGLAACRLGAGAMAEDAKRRRLEPVMPTPDMMMGMSRSMAGS